MANIDKVQLPDASQYNIQDTTSGYASQTYVQEQIATINKNTIGLGNVDNTSDLNKPVSTAQQTAINTAVAPKTDKTIIASVESTDTASKTYTTGKQFIRSDGKLYKATTTINSGGTIIVGTNCELSDDITTQIDLNSVYKKFKFQNIEDVFFQYVGSEWRINIIMNLGSVYRANLELYNRGCTYAISVDSGVNWTTMWKSGIDADRVSVTADGTKTWAQIFSDLYALINATKINSHSKLLIGPSVYNIRAITTGALAFTGVSADPTNMVIDNFVVNVNVADCHYYSCICRGNPAAVTSGDYVSNVVAASTVVAIEY